MSQAGSELLELADLFIQNEQALAEFYQACQELFPTHGEAFRRLETQERGHAELFSRIKAAIQANPSAFAQGRFYPQTLRLMIADIQRKTAEARQKKLNANYALTYMMDTENSLLEGEIGKAFVTSDPEIGRLLAGIHDSTAEHRDVLRTILTKERK